MDFGAPKLKNICWRIIEHDLEPVLFFKTPQKSYLCHCIDIGFEYFMKYCRAFIVSIYLLFSVPLIHAQEHGHDEHEHSRNEIGFSSGALYAFGHHEWGGGVHLHYFRTLGLHSKWSLGGTTELAWADGNHFNVGAGVKYQLFSRLGVSLFPGVTFFSNHETEAHHTHQPRKAHFALHFEGVYDLFHWDNFHMGTVVDYSRTKNDSHSMIGIHAAFCF